MLNPLTIFRWSNSIPMKEARDEHKLVHLNGFIYAIGGRETQKSVEKYNLATKIWIIEASLNVGRIGHSAILYKEKIYVVGGKYNIKSCEMFDPVLFKNCSKNK